MKGYNNKRVVKQPKRETRCKVLTVWNGKAFTRVNYKSLEFYRKELGVKYQNEIGEHRVEYFNEDDRCVMIFEF